MLSNCTRRAFLWGSACSLCRAAVAADAQELRAAVRAARPGDEVLLRDGEWRDAELLLEAAGAPDAPVVVRPETPGGVTLTGRSRLRFSGSWLRIEGLFFRDCVLRGDLVEFRTSSSRHAAHCTLAECAAVDCVSLDPAASIRWVSLYGAYNEVTRCYFAGKRDLGATLVVWLGDEPNYHRIGENRFGPRPPLGMNGGETLRVGDSSTSMRNSRTTVENNLFERCDGEFEIVSNKSCENIYQSNSFERCAGTLTLRHGNRCRVDGNFFFGGGARGTGGVRVIGEDHVVVNNYFERLTGTESRAAVALMNGLPDSPLSGYFQVQRAVVAFNSILDCADAVRLGTTGGNRDLVLRPLDCVMADNVEAQEGPAFERAADGLLRPRAAAAADGSYLQVTHDIDGQERGAERHAGCDQISAEPPRRHRPTTETTGPSWLAHVRAGLPDAAGLKRKNSRHSRTYQR